MRQITPEKARDYLRRENEASANDPVCRAIDAIREAVWAQAELDAQYARGEKVFDGGEYARATGAVCEACAEAHAAGASHKATDMVVRTAQIGAARAAKLRAEGKLTGMDRLRQLAGEGK